MSVRLPKMAVEASITATDEKLKKLEFAASSPFPTIGRAVCSVRLYSFGPRPAFIVAFHERFQCFHGGKITSTVFWDTSSWQFGPGSLFDYRSVRLSRRELNGSKFRLTYR